MTPVTEIATSARRPPHVMRGDGTVRPTRAIWFEGELVKRRERFALDHPLVRAHPEWFEPAYSRDRKVLVELSGMIERSLRARTRTDWHLGTAGNQDKSWHLR